ncbi:MAG TPA: hypothetical protein VGV17_24685 [Bosea sp. (in: a-proteobacteria)]|jgi:hypothetical protein|uniref:hypothetical protein n=1 Tax=Bosea sp. (in: a-proteobacteria) TaxID=1871050 RepID=UPI002DDC91B2|nr:hypothetical protein [Bosea sp. (in: a-proteobacteria)]HEV2556958.1 hypothetical protein [Bosea sp. (in: a-proteobacteria)]
MTLKVTFVAAALLSVAATPSHAFLLLLGAGARKYEEPTNEARPKGPFLTTEQQAAEAVKRREPPPVYVMPMDRGMVLAQANQPGEPTREVPFWRIELHPPNVGAKLTDPTAVVFARPGRMTGLFRTQLPSAAAQQLDIHTYRLTGKFRVTEQGSHSFAVRFACTWRCNISLAVADQQVIAVNDFTSPWGSPERIERYATPLPPGEYSIEVVFGFPRPRDAESTVTGQLGAPRLEVLMRRPSDDTLVPIEVLNRVPASRAAVPVPLN